MPPSSEMDSSGRQNPNSETRMTNQAQNRNDRMNISSGFVIRISELIRNSGFGFRIFLKGAAIIKNAAPMVYSLFKMNRAFRMRHRAILLSALTISLAACHQPASTPLPDATTTPTTVPCCQYIISGGVPQPGPKLLQPGDTVSGVIARDLSSPPGKPCTIILIRQAPEGKTR